MKRDVIDGLIQLAFLEGVISTRGAYERSVLRKSRVERCSPASRDALTQQLTAALAVSAPGLATQSPTIGAHLRALRAAGRIQPQDMFVRLGISRNIYRLLEHDRISPLKVPTEVWRRLRTLVSIQTEDLIALIRKTHQLVWYRPAFKTTLARYKGTKGARKKSADIEQAATELFTKASLQIPKEEQAKLDVLFTSLRANVK